MMVDVEALKEKLRQKKQDDNLEIASEEPPTESDPRKWGMYIILGITAALVIFFLGSYMVFSGDVTDEPPTACFKGVLESIPMTLSFFTAR